MKKQIHRKKKKNKKPFRIFNFFWRMFIFASLLMFATGICVILYFAKDIPDLDNLEMKVRVPSVVMQTYDGEIIGTYGDLREDVVCVDDLPDYVTAAFIAVEDRRFYQHFGIDILGLMRAMYRNFIAGHVVEGGSTITQQLAKNILICSKSVQYYDRSLNRKIKELLMSIWLEYKFTKKQIMMMYLNRIYFGAGTYGIDAAARKYFNKSAKNLTVYEAAILAGLLKAPSKYNPTSHTKNAKERAVVVLQAMERNGFIKNANKIIKNEEEQAFSPEHTQRSGCTYFCDYVYDEAKKILGVIRDDIVIVTTCDSAKQKSLEEVMEVCRRDFFAVYKCQQAALVCMDIKGRILAMVGGVNYTNTQFNRATQANRMLGSVFKIFVYGAAFEYGFQLEDMISDAPISINGWKPKNYRWKEQGQVKVIDAFAKSINVVSIRLAQAIGLKKVAEFADKCGIHNVSTRDLSVALGTTSTSLKNITAAYNCFHDGKRRKPICISEIRTKDGEILYTHNYVHNDRIIDQETLKNCRHALRAVIERGSGRLFNISYDMYGKSGTNGMLNGNQDAWFICLYSPPNKKDCLTVGAWAGNDSYDQLMSPLSSGSRIPAILITLFMQKIGIAKESNILPRINEIVKNDKNRK